MRARLTGASTAHRPLTRTRTRPLTRTRARTRTRTLGAHTVGVDLDARTLDGRINGAPGFLSVDASGVLQTTAVSIRDGRIAALWIVRNPEKLRHLPREHA